MSEETNRAEEIEPYIWVGVLLTVLILIGAYHLGQRPVDDKGYYIDKSEEEYE